MSQAEAKQPTGKDLAGARRASWWLWAIVALGAVLRLIALGHKSFWLDEIASVVITRLPTPAFWSMLWHAEGNMALYYVLLRPWLFFGVGEASVRVLSAVIGIASIPLMYALGKRLFGETTARIATVFFALNACAIWVSQEARGYSLLVLAVVASTYLFVRLIERPTIALACAYGVVTGLTLYCHYFGMFVPAAHAISLAALPDGAPPVEAVGSCGIVHRTRGSPRPVDDSHPGHRSHHLGGTAVVAGVLPSGSLSRGRQRQGPGRFVAVAGSRTGGPVSAHPENPVA